MFLSVFHAQDNTSMPRTATAISQNVHRKSNSHEKRRGSPPCHLALDMIRVRAFRDATGFASSAGGVTCWSVIAQQHPVLEVRRGCRTHRGQGEHEKSSRYFASLFWEVRQSHLSSCGIFGTFLGPPKGSLESLLVNMSRSITLGGLGMNITNAR